MTFVTGSMSVFAYAYNWQVEQDERRIKMDKDITRLQTIVEMQSKILERETMSKYYSTVQPPRQIKDYSIESENGIKY